jgi:hypothetical protein
MHVSIHGVLHNRDVDGACGIIADGKEFAHHKWDAVYFVVLPLVDYAFVVAFGGIINRSVSCGTQALQNSTRVTPGSDELDPSAGLQLLELGRRYADFYFFAHLESAFVFFF